MNFIGKMVRAGGAPPMKLVAVKDGIAACKLIDGNGVVRRRYHPLRDLTPLWMSLQPRSCWPEITQIDLREIEDEERIAAQQKAAKKRAQKKSRRSNKLRRTSK